MSTTELRKLRWPQRLPEVSLLRDIMTDTVGTQYSMALLKAAMGKLLWRDSPASWAISRAARCNTRIGVPACQRARKLRRLLPPSNILTL